jgi:hypothetical protein
MGYSEMGARSEVGSISGLGDMRGAERKNLHACGLRSMSCIIGRSIPPRRVVGRREFGNE